jgi:phosphatidylserine decarboxylase
LRFAEPDTAQAELLAPLTQTHRVSVGDVGFDQDGVLFAGGLGLMAWWLKRSAPKSNLWLLPALAAPIVGLFFRDPNRRVFRDTQVAYSACDGSVLSIERVRDERLGPHEWLRIATFLSILDVHVNRSPIAGKVVKIIEEEGGFAMANAAEAEHNVAQYTVIEDARGRRCVVAQRTGMLARRIVNRARVGNLMAQGERFGLIRFGSRVDVYLPAEHFVAAVQPGDQIEGGTTVIARGIKPAATATTKPAR